MNYKGNIEFRYRKIFNLNKPRLRKLFKNSIFTWILGFKQIMTNAYIEQESVTYEIGDRIGQIVIIPYPQVTFTEVQTLTESDRGENGFGSTDQPTPSKKPRRTKKKVSK